MILASATAIAVPASAPSVRRPPLSLRVVGNELVAGRAGQIRLLGVNRSGAEYACIQGWGFIDGPTGPRAIAAMTSWQIDAVRLPLNEDCWLGINGAPASYSGAPYRDTIRAYVDRLNRAGLYVVLDLHWSAAGSALSTGQEPMADLDHAPAFWASVARTFRSDHGVAFDLYNEPHGISWRCWRDGCVQPAGWTSAGMQTLVDAVRSTGARQPIIATGIGSGNDLSAWLRYRPHDPANQLVAGFHVYNFSTCISTVCWSKQLGPVARTVPVVATEVGETGCSHAFIDRFMAWADAKGVSYLGWTWNPTGCDAPALISAWGGRPTGYGEAFRAHLLRLHAGRLR